jgi:hypothetical protein
MRDALYISMACQGLAVLTDYAWYLFWLVCIIGASPPMPGAAPDWQCPFMQVPGIGAYKLWTSLIGPMMAAKS